MKLAQRSKSLGESATLAVSRQAQLLRAQGVDVINFSAGQPDFTTPAHIRAAAIEALEAGHTGYGLPSSGLLVTRQAVCDRLRRECGLVYEPAQVLIACGGKEALYLAFMALLDEGDEAIVPAPYWVSYPEQIKLAGGRMITVEGPEERGFCITPQQLESALSERTRVVVLNYPSNPGGFTYTARELHELAEVLTGRDLIVISDEMYDSMTYGGREHVSWASLSPEMYEKTLTVNAASKTYAMTGWRLGYAAGPKALIEAMGRIQSQTTSGVVNFTQYGLIAALTGDQACVREMRDEFDARRQIMYSALRDLPGIRCTEPTGAFYCFPNVSAAFGPLGVRGSEGFASALLEQAHIAVVPGSAFGCDRHIRMSYATGRTQITEGLRRFREFLARVLG